MVGSGSPYLPLTTSLAALASAKASACAAKCVSPRDFHKCVSPMKRDSSYINGTFFRLLAGLKKQFHLRKSSITKRFPQCISQMKRDSSYIKSPSPIFLSHNIYRH